MKTLTADEITIWELSDRACMMCGKPSLGKIWRTMQVFGCDYWCLTCNHILIDRGFTWLAELEKFNDTLAEKVITSSE